MAPVSFVAFKISLWGLCVFCIREADSVRQIVQQLSIYVFLISHVAYYKKSNSVLESFGTDIFPVTR